MNRLFAVAAKFSLLAVLASLALTAQPAPKVFTAHLDGGQEVPIRETLAQGQAIFKVTSDGNGVEFKVIASNIQNIVASHIHIGQAGTNGPVVAFLFGSVPPGGGRTDGVLAEGTITSANLIGPLAGASMDTLLSAMRDGLIYVNVHTNDGVAPTNEGPGDFPGGEIRGQLRPNGPKK